VEQAKNASVGGGDSDCDRSRHSESDHESN
jgi:hypothetical protein